MPPQTLNIINFYLAVLFLVTVLLWAHCFFTRSKEVKGSTDWPLRITLGTMALWMAIICGAGIWAGIAQYPVESIWMRMVDSLQIILVPYSILAATCILRRHKVTWGFAAQHLLPFLAGIVLIALFPSRIVDLLTITGIVVYILIMGTKTLIAVRQYQRFVREEYASVAGRSLRWVYYCIALTGVVFVVWVLFFYFRSQLWQMIFTYTCLIVWNYFFIFALRFLHVRERSEVFQAAGDISEQEMVDAERISWHQGYTDSTAFDRTIFADLLREKCEDTELYLRNTITRQQLCREMHIDQITFTNLLHDVKGMNFMDYINSLRIEKAKQLLLETDMSWVEVAAKVGYLYKETFYNIFNLNVGVPPQKYRSERE